MIDVRVNVNVNLNVNVQYLSTRESCDKLQNCADFSDGDFRDGGSAFQHVGPETAKAREPYVTITYVGGISRSRSRR